MRTILQIGTFLLLGAFSNDSRTLDLKYFTIDVPNNWNYIKQRGIDSFVGEIRGPKIKLSFDCSHMGYASSLIQTPEEYIKRQVTVSYSHLFNKPGVIYTHETSVENVKKAEMEKLNTTDTSLVKARPFIRPLTRLYKPSEKDLEKFKNADYLVDLTYNDSTITVGVTLPDDIRKHNIRIDTVDQFIIKTVWPKKIGDGLTGVYYRKLNSRFNLQINGTNLGERQQVDVLKALKTIKIKE